MEENPNQKNYDELCLKCCEAIADGTVYKAN